MYDMQPAISAQERRQILHNILAMEVSQGNRVAWVGLYEAHLLRMPAPINHVLHALLTLLTFGLWLVIWVVLSAAQPKPVLFGIAVDEHGQPYMFDPPK